MVYKRAKRFELIADHTSGWLDLRDSAGKLTYVSPGFERITGYKCVDYITGKVTTKDLFPREELKKIRCVFSSILKKKRCDYENLELKMMTKDKHKFYVSLACQPVLNEKGKPSGFCLNFRDITEIKTAQARLKESEERYYALFEQAPESVVIVDPATGKITDFNDSACKNLGYTREEFAKLGIKDFETIESNKEVMKHLKKIIRRGYDIFETKHRKKSGEVRDVRINAKRITIRGKDFVHTVWTDITDLKKIERKLKEHKNGLEKELTAAQKALQKAKHLSSVGALAATVAHELRNPLGVIKTAAYNIKKKQGGTALDGHLANIDKKIAESEQIIKNLLSYSRIQMPGYERVCFLGILDECIGHLKDKYPAWQVAVTASKNCEDDAVIEADPVQLAEVYTNVLDNSYQAFPAKNGNIEININYDRMRNTVELRFKDDGAGFDPKNKEKVFEPFFTGRVRGTGLGLSVCRQIAGLHDGEIYIESKKGRGTTVSVSLPILRGGVTYERNKNFNG